MTLRSIVYGTAAVILVLVCLITLVEAEARAEFSPDSSFLLGPATIPIALVATVIVLIAIVDFFVWLSREKIGTATKLVFVGLVLLSLVAGAWRFWNSEVVWLVENDIEVRFARDTYLPVVAAAVSGGVTCLVSWYLARYLAPSERRRSTGSQPQTS
jgi:hypothetical protein